jgi:hypothetical protein
MSFIEWIRTLFSGRPHFYIGGRDNPYLLRWYLIPRNRWLNVYLHKFMRDDDDRAMHCHPWWFISILIKGEYAEHRGIPGEYHGLPMVSFSRVERRAPSIAYRRATDRHRIELRKFMHVRPIPCWTIVITGRKLREWGFYCPKGFVPWHEFVAQEDHGNIGKGCGD